MLSHWQVCDIKNIAHLSQIKKSTNSLEHFENNLMQEMKSYTLQFEVITHTAMYIIPVDMYGCMYVCTAQWSMHL